MAGSNGPHRKPIKSWLPSSLQRKTNEFEEGKPAHRKRKESPDPAQDPTSMRADVAVGDIPRGGARGRGRGRGGRSEQKPRAPTDGDFQETINSGSPPDYPSSKQGPVRGRGHHSRGRGGVRNGESGNDSPGQRSVFSTNYLD